MFISNKITPPPHVLSNLLIYLILFSSFCLTANAKTVNRQAYKVCKTNEEAYWNGSSAQCCDTTTHKLVKNYTNGIGENGYACCPVQENINENTVENGVVHRSSSKTGWTIAGATNGSCCGGYTDSSGSVTYDDIGYQQWSSNSYTFNIQENGGVYYCASNMTDSGGDSEGEGSSWSWSFYYASNNKYCMDQRPAYPLICYCSEKGDPQKGTCCEGPC